MNRIGLDLGSNQIKAVEVLEQTGLLKLVSYDISEMPPFSISSQNKSDRTELTNFLKEYLFSSKFSSTNIVLCIPESQVFTKIIETPLLSDNEIKESVRWEAQQYFPDSIDNLSIHYQVLPKSKLLDGALDKNKREVFLVAVSKSLIDSYMEIFEQIGVTVYGIEPESMSICRGVQNVGVIPITMAINIGAESTDIIVVDGDVIRFTRTVATGVDALGRAISQDIGIDEKKSKSYLESYGLDETKLDGKIANSIKPIFDIILNEIRRSITFFESRKKDQKIERIVICGGGALIPGLISYLTSLLGVECEIANPWRNLDTSLVSKKDNLDILGPLFTTAVGLALKKIV